MQVNKLSLLNYRNIENSIIEFDPGVNVLYGKNANGKTNTIEALYFFAVGKHFRASGQSDFISFGYDDCSLFLDFTGANQKTNSLSSKFLINDRKRMYYNNIKIFKVSEFIGNFRAVLFTPDNLSLVKGEPSNRRRFLDLSLCQLKPVYLSYLSKYNSLLAHRNALLKKIKQNGAKNTDLLELSVWTERFIPYASIITRYRYEFIKRLKLFSENIYLNITDKNEILKISYRSQILSSDNDATLDREESERLYTNVYESLHKAELQSGTTLFGPHKDDLIIEIAGKNAKMFASQGQQRSAVMSLKLGEGEVFRDAYDDYPVYLFDDILSELDSGRQKFILERLHGKQIIITCCSPEIISKKDDIKYIHVENGKFY